MSKDLIPADIKLKWKEAAREPQIWQTWRGVGEKLPSTAEDAGLQTPVGLHTGRVVKTISTKTDLPAVNQLISDAADYFEQGGAWCQNAVGTDTAVCAVGALLRMESGDKDNVYNETQPFRHPLTSAAVSKLADHLHKTKALKGLRMPVPDQSYDPDFSIVSAWNDKPGRTKSEIVNMLRDAADE